MQRGRRYPRLRFHTHLLEHGAVDGEQAGGPLTHTHLLEHGAVDGEQAGQAGGGRDAVQGQSVPDHSEAGDRWAMGWTRGLAAPTMCRYTGTL